MSRAKSHLAYTRAKGLMPGGVNSPAGAVVGALLLVGLPELLRIAPSVRIVGYGVLLLLAIRFRPQGLWMVKA